ncbi:MAG TPA: nucleotidyl transferase AbiEii/AbiGii toxin family protein [Ornithinibacter sp.]|nr:nucleotidyl transferase AbiEii/AbiGii toxin family protein [Ornithinibacter sp.]
MTGAVEASLRQLAADLVGVGLRWTLIGGFAVSARAEPRFTRDVDVCVLVDDDEEAEGTGDRLVHRGYTVDSVVEHEKRQRLATIRLISPVSGGVLVDLLFASSGIEAEIVEASEPLEILPGLVVPVARAAHLVVLKLLARDDDTRPQDAIDLRALRPTLTPADDAEVRRLAALVRARGFHRDRDLMALAEEYLARR